MFPVKQDQQTLAQDRTFLPLDIIAVSVIERECPLSVRTGESGDSDGSGSAATMDSEKSAPAVRRTRDEGKNRKLLTVARCGLLIFWYFAPRVG